MANTKISALTSGNPALTGDVIPIDRAGANFSVTPNSILTAGVAASLVLAGATNGTASITAPAVAGTTTNPFAFSNNIAVPSVRVGTNPSTTGAINIPNGTLANSIYGRNAANTNDIIVAQVLSDNGLYLGGGGASGGPAPSSVNISSASGTMAWGNGNAALTLPSTGAYGVSTDTAISRLSAGTMAVGTNLVSGNTGGSLSLTNTSLVGSILTYKNIATVSGGVPAEYATVDLTGQVAAIAATTLYTPTATGMFRISAYLKITTPGTSPVFGPITITYTDGTDSVAQSVIMATQTQAGVVGATGNAGNSTTSVLTGSLIIYAKTGVAIQYAIALTGTVGSGAYEAHLKLEAL